MDDGGGHQVAYLAGFEESEDDLNDPGDDAHGQGTLITDDVVARAQLGDRAEGDDDQTGRRPFDGQPGAAHEGNEQSADDGGQDARSGRETARHRNTKAEWQGNEEDQKARANIRFPGAGQDFHTP